MGNWNFIKKSNKKMLKKKIIIYIYIKPRAMTLFMTKSDYEHFTQE